MKKIHVWFAGMLLCAFAIGTAFAAPSVTKPKNDYNITINYELGMHCTGFDFSYCCVLPPYNSVQSQVIKTSTGPNKFPELLEADAKDPGVLVDGKKRFRLSYGHLDNTYSEGNKLNYWDVPYDVNGDGKYSANENVANAYFSHLVCLQGSERNQPQRYQCRQGKIVRRYPDPDPA